MPTRWAVLTGSFARKDGSDLATGAEDVLLTDDLFLRESGISQKLDVGKAFCSSQTRFTRDRVTCGEGSRRKRQRSPWESGTKVHVSAT